MMGGIDTDIHGTTVLPGLYAAGETACVSINGANRLGSNSLTELLVFGARAGRNAAAFAKNQGSHCTTIEKQADDEERRIADNFLDKDGGTERIAALRREMNETMEAGAGIYRTEESLKKTCEKLSELRERFADIKIEDKSRTFNTELLSAMELDNMLTIARAIAHSALERKESRGSHQRTDFPDRNDDDYLKHSIVCYEDGAHRIEYKNVVITRWPPKERVYGR